MEERGLSPAWDFTQATRKPSLHLAPWCGDPHATPTHDPQGCQHSSKDKEEMNKSKVLTHAHNRILLYNAKQLFGVYALL